MTVWLDNQLPPALAACASDPEIFTAARQANAVVMTKDGDFVDLLEQQGPREALVELGEQLDPGSLRR